MTITRPLIETLAGRNVTRVVSMRRRARNAPVDEPYNVRIDRGSRWGNPFAIGLHGDRDEVIEKFRAWVETGGDARAGWIRDHVGELHGKTLGCWCAPPGGVTAADPLVCHGQILARMAENAVGAR